jgi:hypothetical protein
VADQRPENRLTFVDLDWHQKFHCNQEFTDKRCLDECDCDREHAVRYINPKVQHLRLVVLANGVKPNREIACGNQKLFSFMKKAMLDFFPTGHCFSR